MTFKTLEELENCYDFISHMVQIIPKAQAKHAHDISVFISHMVQIIPGMAKLAKPLFGDLYIPHGSDNTKSFKHAILLRIFFISHMVQIIR